jgi:hypothetical protein
VLRSEGEVIAAAIAELGEDGAHLYGLIDLTRIYLFRLDAHRRVPELLDEVRHFYAEHGKTSFVLFREEGTELDLSSLQVQQDLGFADMSILSANLLPELLECLHEITAPREASDAG